MMPKMSVVAIATGLVACSSEGVLGEEARSAIVVTPSVMADHVPFATLRVLAEKAERPDARRCAPFMMTTTAIPRKESGVLFAAYPFRRDGFEGEPLEFYTETGLSSAIGFFGKIYQNSNLERLRDEYLAIADEKALADGARSTAYKVRLPSSGDYAWHYLVPGSNPVKLSLEDGKETELKLYRLDVANVIVLENDGTTRSRPGTYDVTSLDTGLPITCPELADSVYATETGWDLLPGRYRVTARTKTADGTDKVIANDVAIGPSAK